VIRLPDVGGDPSDDVGPAGPGRLDTDASQVLEILSGVARANRDPDVELARLIATLRGADDAALKSALASLVADADTR
jgi:hypothetical protein